MTKRTARRTEMTWVSRCVGGVLDDRTIVVNGYDLDLEARPARRDAARGRNAQRLFTP